jgi:anti-sigma regulatory factor (Ser/Thr protein kinase)
MASLTVRGTIDSLESIREFVTTAAAEAGLDRKRTYRLVLAMDELATNIATYGYADAGKTGDIDLTATIDDERLTLVVQDTAVPFDPRDTATPDSIDKPLAEKPIGGLGVFLTIKGVDEFHYDYTDGRNMNVLIMNRNG